MVCEIASERGDFFRRQRGSNFFISMKRFPQEILDEVARYLGLDKVIALSEHVAVNLAKSLNRWEICDYVTSDKIDVLKFLHKRCSFVFRKYMMDYAAENGQFEVVNWLHENRTEGCSTRAMNYASKRGDFELIKWLHTNRNEGCTTKAMDWAAEKAHFEIVKWLHTNRNEGFSFYAMYRAAQRGHFDLIVWLRMHPK